MGSDNSITGIWIDENVNNEENKKYRFKFTKIVGFEIKAYENISTALEYLKKLKFSPIVIIVSGRLYPEFIENFKNNINIYKICPKIIIFTGNKEKFYELNKGNKLIDHPFFNSGVVDNYKDLKWSILLSHDELYQIKDIFPLLYEKIQNIFSERDEAKNDIIEDIESDEKVEQFNFEFVQDKEQLILPIFMPNFTGTPTEEEIENFNHYLINKYYTVKEIVRLITQLIRKKKIPIEIISKFWIRAYTVQSNFFKEINADLRKKKINKYLPFIKMMYNAISVNSFSFNPSDDKLYRGTYFDEKELEKIKNYLKNKKEGLPAAIIYSRSFFSFSLNLSVAKRFEKNTILIINNFYSNANGMAEISEFSVFKNEKEVLVFPFSCFEIKEMKVEEKTIFFKKKKYYMIYLDYLGKYEKLFKGEDLKNLVKFIPKDSQLSSQILATEIMKESYQEEISNTCINLKYKISSDEKIRIFGEKFVSFNMAYCKYSYEGKKYELNEFFYSKDLKTNKKELEIKLIIFGVTKNLSYLFNDCKSLISIDSINQIKIDDNCDMSNMFRNCSSLISINPNIHFVTDEVNNMKNLFQGCSSLKSLPDISNWNTGQLQEMENMFKDCTSLISLPDISKWDTSNVKNMGNLFSGCNSLSSLPDISLWNTHKVINMENMFKDCSSITSLPDISKWDTSNVKNMGNLFNGCTLLSSLPDISKWNMENNSDISLMFSKCKSLSSLPEISNWNINKTNKYFMFAGCSKSLKIPNKFK